MRLDEPDGAVASEALIDVTADDVDYEPDNVQRYLSDVGSFALMTAEEERATADAHACGRLCRAAGNDRAQSAPRRVDRQALREARPSAAGPHRGRKPRADACAGEVRTRARLPLLDLCDMVDPAGGRARGHESGTHDPAAGPCAARTEARHGGQASPRVRGGVRGRGAHRGHRSPHRSAGRGDPRRTATRRAAGLARCPAGRGSVLDAGRSFDGQRFRSSRSDGVAP